jgi:nitrogen regulatory protein PII
MKAIVVITDSEAMREFERTCLALPGRGFTIIPAVVGRGKTGLKAGDRVHPGGSSLMFTVVADDQLASTLDCLRSCRDQAGVTDATKIYVADVEDVS